MRRICFTAHITNDAPTAPTSFPNFVHGDAKTVARRHPAPDHRRAIRAHDHTVIGPPRGCEIERARAHVRFQLSGATDMRKAERLGVDRSTSNKNGQAAPGPAVLVERGVHVDHQALPQTAFPPGLAVLGLPTGWGCPARNLGEPNTMLRACPQPNTRCWASRPEAVLSPWRGSRRRHAGARRWSCPGTPIRQRTPPSQPGICPGGSNREARASPTPPQSP